MTLQQQLATELNLRAQLLPEEVTLWQELADKNQHGMGIHQSQVRTVKLLFEELEHKQQQVLAGLNGAQGQNQFVQKRRELEDELSATHGIMAIFRNILAQRQDKRYYRQILDAADLIVADCYNSCINSAAEWGAISKEKFRVPPLTYLNTMFSPAAFTRRHFFGAFKMPLNGYVELKLPISVVSLPFHHTEAIWTFCTIYHEVGHLLDQDLELRDALRDPLQRRLDKVAANKDSKRVEIWTYWLWEMIADTFGVLLGGEGFVYTMIKLLLLPNKKVIQRDSSDMHPTPYVRIFLLGALLRAMGQAHLRDVADMIERKWREWYGQPRELMAYVAECPAVAELLLHEKILQGRSLYDFSLANNLVHDQERIADLERYLRLGFMRPIPKHFPVRLVPAAAQVAASNVRQEHAKSYPQIQKRGLEFIQALREDWPEFLAEEKFSPRREAYLRSLVKNMNFSALEIES